MFKDDAIFFLYLLKPGSDFDKIVEGSQNHLRNTAIGPGTFISKNKKKKQSPKFVCPMEPLWSPYRAPLGPKGWADAGKGTEIGWGVEILPLIENEDKK